MGVLHEGADYQFSTTGPDYYWIAYRGGFNRSALAVAGRVKPPKASILSDLICDTESETYYDFIVDIE